MFSSLPAAQLKVLQQVEGSSCVLVKDLTIGGIIMVRHVKLRAVEELVEPVAGLYNKNINLNENSNTGIKDLRLRHGFFF
jgi:hypothetical protein